jgi:hypothetical protein
MVQTGELAYNDAVFKLKKKRNSGFAGSWRRLEKNCILARGRPKQRIGFSRRRMMNKKSAIAMATFAFLVFAPRMMAQDKAQLQKAPAKAAAPATTEKDQNLKEYIKLLREDVRSQKSAVMSAVMQLDPDEATKFWPIYRDYDAELSKLNDLRVANIEEYSRTYNQLTNEKADELIHNAMAFQKQRGDLLAKYYDRLRWARLPPPASCRWKTSCS